MQNQADLSIDALALAAKIGKIDPHARNRDGETPLHIAARTGQLDIIAVLLKAKAPLDAMDRYGNTPLHAAAFDRRWDAVNLLLDAGADPHALNKMGRNAINSSTMRQLVWEADKRNPKKITAAARQAAAATPAAPKPATPAAPTSKPAVPAYTFSPERILLKTPVDTDYTLVEIFDFVARERISLLEKTGVPGAPARDHFNVLLGNDSLKRAYAEHVKRGGRCPESAIAAPGKSARPLDLRTQR